MQISTCFLYSYGYSDKLTFTLRTTPSLECKLGQLHFVILSRVDICNPTDLNANPMPNLIMLSCLQSYSLTLLKVRSSPLQAASAQSSICADLLDLAPRSFLFYRPFGPFRARSDPVRSGGGDRVRATAPRPPVRRSAGRPVWCPTSASPGCTGKRGLPRAKSPGWSPRL
jgi:hypothetical protein